MPNSCRMFCLQLVLRVTCLLVCALFAASPAAAVEYNAGYRSLVTWLPGPKIRVDVAVWYPAQRSPSQVKADSWFFPSARNATPLPGLWPLIILSHDSPGSRFAHHDLAIALTGQGYMVAAPTHDGDNAQDMRLLFSDLQLPSRAHQLSATLDLILQDPVLGPQVDGRRIGLVGFGNGGSAGFLLAGALQTPDVWPTYCEGQDETRQADPYCTPYMSGTMDKLIRSMQDRAGQFQESQSMREQARAARAKALNQIAEGVAKAYPRVQRGQRKPVLEFPKPPVYLPLLPALQELRPLQDPRFRAMAFVSPGLSMLFDRESLADINIPLLFVAAEKDALNKPEQQAALLRRLIAPPTPEYATLPDADGPSLQALCPPDMLRDLPDLCASVSSETRLSIHNRLKALLLAFFQKTLR